MSSQLPMPRATATNPTAETGANVPVPDRCMSNGGWLAATSARCPVMAGRWTGRQPGHASGAGRGGGPPTRLRSGLEQDLDRAVLLLAEVRVRLRRLLERHVVGGEVVDAQRIALGEDRQDVGHPAPHVGDRKSVVEGKSVDLGGGRIINKNNAA